MKKLSLFLLFAVLVYLVPVNAQVVSGGGAIRNVSVEPTGSCSTTEVRQYQGSIYTCSSGTWTVSSGGVSDATITAKGKAKLGGRAVYAVGSLPTCNSSSVDTIVSVSDKNKGRRECREVSSGVYKWVDPTGGYYYVEDFGAVPDGSTNSTAAVNACIAAAIADTGNKGATVVFPAGTIIADIQIWEARGLKLKGQGKYATKIQPFTNSASPISANGWWYGGIDDMMISVSGSSNIVGGGVLEIDGNYGATNPYTSATATLQVQGLNISNVYIEANNAADYGIAFCRQGGSVGQCSEILLTNVHVSNARIKAHHETGFNALAIKYVNGNFQGNKQTVLVNSGAVDIDGTGYQEYAITGGARQHIDNGAPIELLNSSDDISKFRNSRFENFRLFKSQNGHKVVFDSNYVLPSGTTEWTALTAITQGTLIRGVKGAGATGHIYIAIQGGTTGASEPTWPAANVAFASSGGNISSGDKTFDCSSCGNLYAGEVLNGMGIVIDRGGGSAFYSTMDTRTDNSTWELNDAAPATITNKAYHIGATVTDGSVVWMQYDFNEIETNGTSVTLQNNVIGYGHINIGSSMSAGPVVIFGNTFARTDWLKGLAGNYPNTPFIAFGNQVLKGGGPNTGGSPAAYPCSVRNGGPVPTTYLSPFCIGGSTLVFTGGTAGTNAADISLAPDFTNNWLLLTGGLKLGDLTADRLLYVNSDKKVSAVTVGSGLSFSGGTLSNTGSGVTANNTTGVIPYLSASNVLSDSPVTRTGSAAIAVAGTLTINNGSNSYIYGDTTTPFIRLSNVIGSEFGYGVNVMSIGGANVLFSISGVEKFRIGTSYGFNQFSGGLVGWSSTSESSGAPDTALSRNAAGVVEINNGSAGTYRDLKLRNLFVQDTGTATATAGAATANVQVGTITSESLTTAAGAAYTLTLTNSLITTSSRIFISFTDGTNTQGTLELGKVTAGSGSATIVIRNTHASEALNGTIKISYMVF